MTKKDYQAIARAIHTAREDNAHTQDWHEATAGEVTRTVADALAADNPRFDRARFIKACETGDATAESCGRLKSTACDWDRGCRKHRN